MANPIDCGSTPRGPRAPRSARSAALAVLVAALLVAPGCRRREELGAAAPDAGEGPAPVRIVYPSAPGSFVKVIERAARSVIHLYTDLPVRDGPADWFPGGPAHPSPGEEELVAAAQRALGSGLLLDRQGHVLTNAHIVGEKRAIWARLSTGDKLKAKVVGLDESTDLAVLEVTLPTDGAPPAARLGQSRQLHLGEWVVALGDPFGHGPRANAGIVSALPRADTALGPRRYWDFIQTDAAISAGNSGGPLINSVGEVVGLCTAVKGDATGVGFALPVEVISQLLPALIRDGRIVRSWVGMYIDRVPPEVARSAGLEPPRGALVTGLVAGGPADQAGLRKGDIVLTFGDKPVQEASELPWAAAHAGPDKAIPLTVWRDGAELKFTLRTQRMPE